MIIKDLVIKFEDGKIHFYGEVLIERNFKSYVVPVRIESNRGDYKETIEYAMDYCRDVHENWKVKPKGPLKASKKTGIVIGERECDV